MSRKKKVLLLSSLAVLVLLLVFGCSLLPRDDSGVPASDGWYIKLQIKAPAGSKGIAVTDYQVTGLKIQVRDPEDEVLQTIDWEAEDGPQSYLIPVKQRGEHEIEVTHVGERNGEVVEATESAAFNIQAMVITVIDIVPGCIGVIRVEGQETPPQIDLTGYWDLYFMPEGQPDIGPIWVYIQQTGSALEAPFRGGGIFSGSIDGSNVTLQGDPGGGDQVLLTGTVSGDQITGHASSPMGEGTFTMVHSALPFGHLEMEGSYQGLPISLNTENAIGTKGETVTTHRLRFNMNIGSYGADVWLSSNSLSVGDFTVVTEESDEEAGLIQITLWERGEHRASGGSVRIDSYDSTSIAGRFDDLIFPEGKLTGTFNLVFGTSNGTVNVEQGIWPGGQFPTMTPNASSQMSISTRTSFVLWYWDNLLSAYLWFNVAGEDLEAGRDYALPDEAWGSLHWSYNTEEFERDIPLDGPGSLYISGYDVAGIAGSFQAHFPDGSPFTGDFDVSFGF